MPGGWYACRPRLYSSRVTCIAFGAAPRPSDEAIERAAPAADALWRSPADGRAPSSYRAVMVLVRTEESAVTAIAAFSCTLGDP